MVRQFPDWPDRLPGPGKTVHLIATWQDIQVLESINKTFAPVADLTDIISGEDYITVSNIKPFLHHISNKK